MAKCACAFLAVAWCVAVRADAPVHRATLILLDASGSLHQTDPGDLRTEAARLFIDATSDGDKVQILSFAGETTALTGGWIDIGQPSRPALRDALARVPRNGRYTDHAAALESAASMFEAAGPAFRAQYAPTVLLFTDGMLDPDPRIGTRAQRSAALDRAVERLRSAGAAVYGVALGASDTEILTRAADRTGGQLVAVQGPEGLLRSFWHLRERFSASYAITEAKRATGTVDLDVPDWATSVTVAVLGATHSGDDVRVSGLDCERSAGAAYAFLRCPHPVAGKAKIEVRGAPAEVLVSATGDVHAVLEIEPVQAVVGEPLNVSVSVRGRDRVLGGMPFLKSAVVTAEFEGAKIPLYDDGAAGDRRAGDGVFSRTVRPTTGGSRRLSARISGDTFALEAARDLEVLQAPVELVASWSEVACLTDGGCTAKIGLRNHLKTSALRVRGTGAGRFEPLLVPAGETAWTKARFQPPISGAVDAPLRIAVEGYQAEVIRPAVVRRLTTVGWLLQYWFISFPLLFVVGVGVTLVTRPVQALRERIRVHSMRDGVPEILIQVDLGRLRQREVTSAQLVPNAFRADYGFTLASIRKFPLGSSVELRPTGQAETHFGLGKRRIALRGPRLVARGDVWETIGSDGCRYRFEI
jgi:hypothetical protein